MGEDESPPTWRKDLRLNESPFEGRGGLVAGVFVVVVVDVVVGARVDSDGCLGCDFVRSRPQLKMRDGFLAAFKFGLLTDSWAVEKPLPPAVLALMFVERIEAVGL